MSTAHVAWVAWQQLSLDEYRAAQELGARNHAAPLLARGILNWASFTAHDHDGASVGTTVRFDPAGSLTTHA